MNIIEAQQMVNQYIDALAKCPPGCELMPASVLPFYTYYTIEWKNKLMDASKLYISYVILCNTWTQEQIERYLDLLIQMDRFAPDVEVRELNEALELKAQYNNELLKKVHASKLKKADETIQQIMKKRGNFIEKGTRRKDELIKFFNQMLSYKISSFDSQQKEGENFFRLIDEYCQKTYRTAGIESGQNDSFNFYLLAQCESFFNAPAPQCDHIMRSIDT